MCLFIVFCTWPFSSSHFFFVLVVCTSVLALREFLHQRIVVFNLPILSNFVVHLCVRSCLQEPALSLYSAIPDGAHGRLPCRHCSWEQAREQKGSSTSSHAERIFPPPTRTHWPADRCSLQFWFLIAITSSTPKFLFSWLVSSQPSFSAVGFLAILRYMRCDAMRILSYIPEKILL